MPSFLERSNEHIRLIVLRTLAAAPGYSANDSLLHDAVRDWGVVASRDVVRTNLAWLAEQGLVHLEEIAGVMVVHIAQRGIDVASGEASVPGVKRPSPKD